MSWVDVLVLLVAGLAGCAGWRHGLLMALSSFTGVLVGAFAGIRLAQLTTEPLEAPVARVLFGIGVVVVLVATGELAGVALGQSLRRRFAGGLDLRVDRALGSAVQALTVVTATCLVALPAASVRFSGLADGVRESWLVAAVQHAAGSVLPSTRRLTERLRAQLGPTGSGQVPISVAHAPSTGLAPPDPALASGPAVLTSGSRVLRVRGRAVRCSRQMDGSGFVVARERVITNAHVVAGASDVQVEVVGGDGEPRATPSRVVAYDPEVDVAVLAVPGLRLEPLQVTPRTPAIADNALVLGYPMSGPFEVTAVRILERLDLRNPDIYGNLVDRDVYVVRGLVRPGNSGGPLVGPDGTVYGMVFGAATGDNQIGYVLTVQQIDRMLRSAAGRSEAVPTGPCAT